MQTYIVFDYDFIKIYKGRLAVHKIWTWKQKQPVFRVLNYSAKEPINKGLLPAILSRSAYMNG